jgi:transposase-like protein
MAWCSGARPAPARWRGPCWSRSACARTVRRRSSTSGWPAESAAQWEQFLTDLIRRGLTGKRLEMLCVDGGAGLLAALPTAFPDIPVQRCWAHKIREDLLTCFCYPTLEERKAVRATNAIERRFREVRRRTRPMGTFQDRTSMERILFAVFMHENRNQGLATPFALTQTF